MDDRFAVLRTGLKIEEEPTQNVENSFYSQRQIPFDKAMDLAAESLQFTLLAADCEFGVADDRCDLLAAVCVVKMIDNKGNKYKFQSSTRTD